MPDPAPTRRESSKPVPVGEPPTPEGWPKTIWFCEQCGEQPGAVNLPCACVDWGKRIKVQAFRVAPVGGAGQEVEKVIANMRAFAKGQEEIADPKHDSAYHLRTSYISYFRSLADQLERAAPVGGAGQEHGDDDSLASARGFLQWLVAMDEPEDVEGRADRQTVTLTKIIDKARTLLDQTGEPPASQSPESAAGVGGAGVRLTPEEAKALHHALNGYEADPEPYRSGKQKLVAMAVEGAASVGEGDE